MKNQEIFFGGGGPGGGGGVGLVGGSADLRLCFRICKNPVFS